MNVKTLNVFYGSDFLPYKDQERSVHYPVVGSDFQGANDITEIHFYIDRVCGVNTTFAVAIKLPNGKLGSKILSPATFDSALNENYVTLPISQFITQMVGGVTISLKAYQGDIELEYDDETELYSIPSNTPIIASTGIIKLNVNYATSLDEGDLSEEIDMQALLGLLATKLNIVDGIITLGNISTANLSGYDNGQLFYDKYTDTYYKKVATSPYYEKVNGKGVLGAPHILCRLRESNAEIEEALTLYGNDMFVYDVAGRDYLFLVSKPSTFTAVAFEIETRRTYIRSGMQNSDTLDSVISSTYEADLDLGNRYVKTAGVEIGDIYHTIELVSGDLVIGSGLGDIWLQPSYVAKYITSKGEGEAHKVEQYEISNVDFVLDQCIETTDGDTLDELELEYASRPNSSLKLGNSIYRYAYADSTYIYHRCVDDEKSTNLSGYDTYTINSFVRIKKSDGKVESGQISFDFYNKTQSEGKFATNFTASLDPTTYVITFVLKNANGSTLATQMIDLPLESIVTSMTYYDTYTYDGTTYHNVLVIVLATTSVPTIVPVGSLISGLEHEALVEVSDISTPLTASQLALLEYPNAMITYGNDVYLKAEDNGTYITLSVPYISLTTNSGHEEATRKFIVVTKSSGDMALTSDTTSFYNKSQTDTLLGEKADASSVVTDSDIETLGGTVTRIRKGNTWNEVAEQVDISTTPKVVQSVADLPADNDGYLYVVLDNGYLYSWDEENQEWAQQYQYTSDLFTVTQVEVGGDDYSYIEDKANDNRPIQVASASKDGNGDVIDETYAKISDLENGLIEPEVSKTAKNLLPVSQNSGSIQTAPFINQGTATNNNDSQAQVDTGTLGQHLEKQGNTIVVNQLARELSSRYWSSVTAGVSYSSGIATFTATAQYGRIASTNMSIMAGHKYLLKTDITLTSGTNLVWCQLRQSSEAGTLQTLVCGNTTNKQTLSTIINASATENAYIRIIDTRSSGWDAIQVSNVRLIDLTQWFNGDIPQDLLDHPDNFFHYYNGSLDYNLGTLVNSNGRYLVNGNQNAWDEEWEVGSLVGGTINSKNYISVIPNTTYFLKSPYACGVVFYDSGKQEIMRGVVSANNTFTTPSNCCYIKFYCSVDYGTTYNHDITISLYYVGEDYSQYIPYKAPEVYDTGDEVLRKAGSVKDYKEPNGTIHRLVGMVDLGTLDYSHASSGGREIFYAEITDLKSMPSSSLPINAICPLYRVVSQSASWVDMDISYQYGNHIAIVNNSYSSSGNFKTAMSGVYLYFELATPTTEQGTPFTENMDINDMGNMAWYSAYTDENTNTLVSVPQGCKIFYPAWYVGFIDTLGQREDIEWSTDEIVSQEQLGEVDDKHDNLYAIVNQNLGGILRHQLAQANNIDFNNTAWVDLGTLNWTYSNGFFYANVSGLKKASATNVAGNLLCVLYSTVAQSVWQNSDKNIWDYTSSSDTNISVKDTSAGTDATSFKNAMKGILLAYEKES